MLSKETIQSHIKPLLPIPTETGPVGKLTTPIGGVIFDIYGTLFISDSGDISLVQDKNHHLKPLSDLLKKYHVKHPVGSILSSYFNEIKASHTRQRESGVDCPEVNIIDIWTQVLKIDNENTVKSFSIEFELIVNPVYPMPHLKQLLTWCKANRLLMGIISNAQFYTPLMFEWFLGSTTEDLGFHPLITLYSYKFGYAKPSAFLYQEASRRLATLNVDATSVLYVGNDMLNDIYPAQKHGFKTALFAGDKRSLRLRAEDERCYNLSPNLVITDLLQLTNSIS